MKRFRITIRGHCHGGWTIATKGKAIVWVAVKKNAIKLARSIGRRAWKQGQLAQVVCFRRNGTIEWEATYGLDPRRYKG